MRLWSVGKARGVTRAVIGRIATRPVNKEDRQNFIAYGSETELARFGNELASYPGVLCRGSLSAIPKTAVIHSAPNLEYLSDGDVVRLSPDGTISVLYRRSSRYNTILTTERCNSFCLMWSQPPKTT